MKKKLLIVVENFRNIFILLLISKISKKFDLTILTSKKNIPLLIKKKYKIINVEKNWNEKIIDKICIFFSNCHGSHKQLYYLKFQIGSEKNILKYILLQIKFLMSKFGLLPYSDNLYKFFYFFFSKKYDFLNKFNFLLFDFRISDEFNPSKSLIYSTKYNKKLKKISWVYSWDNSYIYSSILNADYFLLWSNTLKKIFLKRHKVNPKKILVNYPIQFQYLKKLKEHKSRTILFSCSYGSNLKNPEEDMKWYVRDDIEMIKHMHQIIQANKLKLKILIRLYPSTNYNEKNLNHMMKYKNLDIDFDSFNFFKKKNFSLSDISNHLNKKNKSINKSLAIFSFGSTFNIEAAILNKPVFHIDYSVVKRSNKLFQYDNFQKDIEDYVFLKKVKNSNVIKNQEEMKKILENLNKNNFSKYLKYSKSLKKIYYHKSEKLNILS
jgi:hypothetical protein